VPELALDRMLVSPKHASLAGSFPWGGDLPVAPANPAALAACSGVNGVAAAAGPGLTEPCGGSSPAPSPAAACAASRHRLRMSELAGSMCGARPDGPGEDSTDGLPKPGAGCAGAGEGAAAALGCGTTAGWTVLLFTTTASDLPLAVVARKRGPLPARGGGRKEPQAR
jgi:hypothetical protein